MSTPERMQTIATWNEEFDKQKEAMKAQAQAYAMPGMPGVPGMPGMPGVPGMPPQMPGNPLDYGFYPPPM